MPRSVGRFSSWVLVPALLGALCLALVACGESSTSDSGDGGTQAAQTAPAETAPDDGDDEPNGYPATLTEPFMHSCTVTAVASAQGRLTSAQARAACAHTLACLERRLTVAELTKTLQKMQAGEVNPGARVMRRCEQRAVEHVLG